MKFNVECAVGFSNGTWISEWVEVEVSTESEMELMSRSGNYAEMRVLKRLEESETESSFVAMIHYEAAEENEDAMS